MGKMILNPWHLSPCRWTRPAGCLVPAFTPSLLQPLGTELMGTALREGQAGSQVPCRPERRSKITGGRWPARHAVLLALLIMDRGWGDDGRHSIVRSRC